MKILSYIWAVIMAGSAIWLAVYSSDTGKWMVVLSTGFSAIFFFVHALYWTPEKAARIFGDLASKKATPAGSEKAD